MLAYLSMIRHNHDIMEQNEKTAIEVLNDALYHHVIERDEDAGKYYFDEKGIQSISDITADEIEDTPKSEKLCVKVEDFIPEADAEIDSRNKDKIRSIGMAALCGASVPAEKMQSAPVTVYRDSNTNIMWIRKES